MKEKIMPPIVLTVICIIVCALLVAANAATKDKVIEAQEEKLQSSLQETFGNSKYTVLEKTYPDVNQVIKDESNQIIFDITVDGYSKNGLQVLIGIDSNGKTNGISIVSINETPGLGTKVQDDKDFQQQFIGLSDADYSFDVITGATYSSKGMKKAVDLAVSTYNAHKEELLSE